MLWEDEQSSRVHLQSDSATKFAGIKFAKYTHPCTMKLYSTVLYKFLIYFLFQNISLTALRDF